MTTLQANKTEIIRNCRSATDVLSQPNAAKTSYERLRMAETSDFCPFPNDPEGCCQTLVEAWQQECLAQHCVITGLQRNCGLCKAILLEGI